MGLINFIKRQPWIMVLSLASIGLFIYYLNKNYNVYYYDESGYYYINRNILTSGLFNIEEKLRTYLYPLIISLVSIFTNGDLFLLKILVSIIQYVVYVYVVFLMAYTFKGIKNNDMIYYTILVFGLLNPYMIHATTLLLTDSLSTCLVVLAILQILRSDFKDNRTYLLIFIFTYAAAMIRPSSIIFAPVIVVILLCRKIMFKDVIIWKCLVFGIIGSIIFIPQIYNNVHFFNHWTPLVHTNLYEFQSNLAASNLKYGTVVIPDENAQLFYKSPYDVDSTTGIFKLAFTNFPAFLLAYTSHLFGVLDWGYIETYIVDFYPISRLVGSLFLYIYWITAFYGAVSFTINEKSKNSRFIQISLIGTFLVYWGFIGTTIIESRFGYPLFLLMLPFSGIGVFRLFESINKNKVWNIKKSVLYSVICILLILLIFYISFLLDYQTGRINWFGFS
ncbi:hypothetical protein D3C74_223060 [compost metagenome]